MLIPVAQVHPFLEDLPDLKILKRQPWYCGGVWLIVVCSCCVWWRLIVVCVSLARHGGKSKPKVHNITPSSIFDGGNFVWTLGDDSGENQTFSSLEACQSEQVAMLEN
jgi:hypothetical protein